MVGLLVLSLALSAPSAAVSSETSVSQPAGSTDSQTLVREETRNQSFDKMELHPASGICYKIRAYVFSQDANPKFLRETTCGPKVTQSRKTRGYKPIVVPPEEEGAGTAADNK